MTSLTLRQKFLAEFLGSAGLLIVVVGSGIMGETLSQGNAGLALLANSVATGAGLYALIQCFAPISGAHFNPVVSFIELLSRRISLREFVFFTMSQICGAVVGVLLTHVMFGQNLLQLSQKNRGEFRFFVSEILATLGLILVISLSGRRDSKATPMAVALYITAAYWCTSSTSFANPAVTIARSLSDTFAGILWTGAPQFIVAQILGALLAFAIVRKLEPQHATR
jgi:glycerol uptake facilitator-like aquaporin